MIAFSTGSSKATKTTLPFTKWGMTFNAPKCYFLPVNKKTTFMYQLDNVFLKEVSNNPYLGLNISYDLTWNFDINAMCKKACSSHKENNLIEKCREM